MADKRSVAVQILGHEYRIRTEAPPESVEQLAGLVEATMERIRDRTGTVDSLHLAVMAALNLANDAIAARAERDPSEPLRIQTLTRDVEAVLGETAP